MRRLENISIQNKLIGIFAVVFMAGVVAIAWNAYSLGQTKDHVTRVVSNSKSDVETIITTSANDVTSIADRNNEDILTVLDRTDELLYLQSIEITFRDLGAIMNEYALLQDPTDESELIPLYHEISDQLAEDLQGGIDAATNDEVAALFGDLETERQAQLDLLDEIVATMQTDPEEAGYLVLDAGYEALDNVYNVLADYVGTDWETTFDEFDQTREQMQASLDSTKTQMSTSSDAVSTQMQSAVDETESQLQTAINISLLTIGLFGLAGVLVIIVVFIVSRQIVRPVLVMSEVAESIEREEYATDSLNPIVQRQDEIGQLARVFQRMASELFARMETLRRQVAQLQIVIDQDKVNREVSEITDSEYFQDLQSKVRQMRQRKQGPAPAPGSD